MKQGKELIVLVGGTVVGASRTCTYDLQQEFIESRSPYSGRTTAKIPTGYSWSVHCACLCVSMAEVKTFTDAVRNGTAITLRFRDSEFVYDYTGTAFVQSLSATGENKALAQYSIDFIGSGDLSEQAWTTINLTTGNTDVAGRRIVCSGSVFQIQNASSYTTHIHEFTLQRTSVVEIKTISSSSACAFLHHNDAETIAGFVEARETANFASATNGFIQHIHGSNKVMRKVLEAGTYTITFMDYSQINYAKTK